ncbi:hypothetical protein [Kordiimonas gwangyangensis]|uniref:hypothetical protein n=1 Tax=Kordiimonas gwangyangensis TaxID=288022 RepID=UPI00036C0A65|nr:hypothetical protein [Kordiimonas gwangyangensis]
MFPGIGVGENGSFSLGADGGPINSSDRFTNSFDTGNFSLRGDSAFNQAMLVLVGVAVGILIWQFVSNRS